MSLSPIHLVQFGECVYDFKARILCRNGSLVPLEPLTTKLLEFLILNPGRIVSQQELIDNIWKTHVSRGVIDFQIFALRKAIGDSDRPYQYIKNRPKLGWYFAAEVKQIQNLLNDKSEPEETDRDTSVALQLDAVPSSSGNAVADVTPVVALDSEQKISTSAPVAAPISRSLNVIKITLAAAAVAIILLVTLASALRTTDYPRVSEFQQVTNNGRPKLGPLFTDGRQLFFSEQRDGKWWIVSVPVAGGIPGLVSGIEADTLLEDVAPDGKSLLLRRVTPNPKELWIFWPSDRSLRLVGGSIDAATWSPFGDGMTISDEIAVSSLENGTREQLFGLSGRRSKFLQWAPDGQILRAWLRRPGDEPLIVWDFNLRQKETHEILGLSKNSDWTTRGMWTHDGRSFIYSSGNDLQKDLWLVKEDRMSARKRPVRLTSGPGSWLWPVRGPDDYTILALQEETRSELVGFDPHDGVWKPMWDGFPASEVEYSRDGKWAAFVHVPNHFLWKSKSDGTGYIQLTSDKIIVHQPHWSPDGRTIAFMGQELNGDWRIFVVPSSGGNVQELSPAQENQGVPSWSADGQSIVFGELLARRKLEEMSLRIVDVASKKMRILEGTKGLWSPRWSPDGKYLLAVTTDSKRIRLLQTGTSTWIDLFSTIFVDNVTWSYDSKFVYFDGQETVGKLDMFRVSVPEGRLEKLTTLQNFVPSHEPWYGVAPDGTLLASRGFHSQEIFALKCVLP